jgi:HK97 gp10 family phage protein
VTAFREWQAALQAATPDQPCGIETTSPHRWIARRYPGCTFISADHGHPPNCVHTPWHGGDYIAVRASKFARQAGDEGVYINVRGIRGAARVRKLGKAGANNPNDPFYWRFLEFGTRKMARRPFLVPAVQTQGEAAITKFMQSVIPQIEKLNARAAKK